MPWTFAHPLAILPLQRLAPRRFNLMALIIGSISPDLGYYVFAFDLATLAHQWHGLLLVCLPVGWVVFMFLRYMQAHFIYLLPQMQRQALQAHMAAPQSLSPSQVTWISIALISGAATHIVWDAFTHANGFAVAYFDVLRQPVDIAGVHTKAFHLLQHLSTLVGVVGLAWCYLQWLKKLPHIVILEPRESDQWRYILFASTAMTSFLLGLPMAYSLSGATTGSMAKEAFLFRLALCATTCFALLLTVAAVLIARARTAPPAQN
ncbi:DUF4184 family protein [Undibacterium pigrum]|uniref:Uncharacterized protein DUF4184 n=1 Tax=Undibacterium pigrum TaxID=401470 RepID=A0A318JK18_9BURK|nr:DUF4184 family protein [Undibacterium pigrum]PXX47703.1 uncharacterized protein DUF4184 [Undibacterium pigrum]